MSVLSYQDIIRELGKGIYFHPLKPGSIKDCDLCLTAGECAYSLEEERRLTIYTEQNQQGEERKYFDIPKKDTALVWTSESVSLSNKFRGPLYSVVKRVSDGLGHIGTRVNPEWSGVLCIALHNVSDKPIRIYVEDVNKPIAYLAVEQLSSRCSNPSNNHKPDISGRLDVLHGRLGRQEVDDYFSHPDNVWMMDNNKDTLKQLMLDSKEYKELKKGVKDTLLGFLGSDQQTRWSAIGSIAGTLGIIISLIALFKSSDSSNLNPKTDTTPQRQANPNKTVSPGSNK
ncbi:hypothetical protein VB638_17540 [Dolichospermum sp. UHCC 0684]|jgi:deoxycytidine triphosphate deaminase|uniref:Deoxycytidine triphosphate deaminase n=1 Tax=Dolichospermum flos-aquae CCAP 1403/13F TaxID=315271 RepID=A0A6H2BX22_DOLFA|nr:MULTISPECIES: hypothetical protein [Dolichospermum]MEA5531349.1 hypothetical protein [Dolichospermum sp. UHCC 0684]MTJ35112.1 hypothetical protein [Dolichospermum sp. UHCC 0260]QJB43324.1 hypothetical protein HGD76_02850 [Dolichospermum flos-aquae CCAP 1403/13F]